MGDGYSTAGGGMKLDTSFGRPWNQKGRGVDFSARLLVVPHYRVVRYCCCCRALSFATLSVSFLWVGAPGDHELIRFSTRPRARRGYPPSDQPTIESSLWRRITAFCVSALSTSL